VHIGALPFYIEARPSFLSVLQEGKEMKKSNQDKVIETFDEFLKEYLPMEYRKRKLEEMSPEGHASMHARVIVGRIMWKIRKLFKRVDKNIKEQEARL